LPAQPALAPDHHRARDSHISRSIKHRRSIIVRSEDIYTGLQKRNSSGLYVLRNRENGGLAALKEGSDVILCLFETPPDAEEYLHNWFNEPGEWVVDLADSVELPDECLDICSHVTINPPLVHEKPYQTLPVEQFMRQYKAIPRLVIFKAAIFRRRQTL
jgi:hypothetical protein